MCLFLCCVCVVGRLPACLYVCMPVCLYVGLLFVCVFCLCVNTNIRGCAPDTLTTQQECNSNSLIQFVDTHPLSLSHCVSSPLFI